MLIKTMLSILSTSIYTSSHLARPSNCDKNQQQQQQQQQQQTFIKKKRAGGRGREREEEFVHLVLLGYLVCKVGMEVGLWCL